MKTQRVAVAAATLAGAMLISGTPAGASAPGAEAKPSPATLTAEGTAKGGAAVQRKIKIVCTVDVNHAHRSGGKRHILFKTRVQCKSKDGVNAAHLKVKGSLIRGKTTPERKVVATSSLTQTIPINGKAVTYYTPKPKGKKINASGWYHGHVYAKITSPVPGTATSVNGKSRYIV